VAVPLYRFPTYMLGHAHDRRCPGRFPASDRLYLGKPLTRELVQAFVQKGIDPCGERGEFHTFVTRYGGFGRSIPVKTGAVHRASGCSAIDLELMG